jgi:inosine/xanthosine triphosphate pyrophosphatase family protein
MSTSREGSMFLSELIWLEKNQILEDELESCRDDTVYWKRKRELGDRRSRGPVPVVLSNGSFRESARVGYSNSFDMYGYPSYDQLRSQARTKMEVDMWDECEKIEREELEESLSFSPYKVVADIECKEKEEPSSPAIEIDFGDNLENARKLADQYKDLFCDDEPQPEREEVKEVLVPQVEVPTAYDVLLMYMYLYSLGEIKEKESDLRNIISIVSKYYISRGSSLKVQENIQLNEQSIATIYRYMDCYFSGGGLEMKKIGLIPHAAFFVTGSGDKYREVFSEFSNVQMPVFRVNGDKPEIQGHFAEVILHKLIDVESQYENVIVEDTSLGLGCFDYKGGTYIKEFITIGAVRFSDKFLNDTTLWISSCMSRRSFAGGKYFLSFYGTEGKIGYPSTGTNLNSFNSINYVDGTVVDSKVFKGKEYDPRHRAMSQLILMMTRVNVKNVFHRSFIHPKSLRKHVCELWMGYTGNDQKAKSFFEESIKKVFWNQEE